MIKLAVTTVFGMMIKLVANLIFNMMIKLAVTTVFDMMIKLVVTSKQTSWHPKFSTSRKSGKGTFELECFSSR